MGDYTTDAGPLCLGDMHAELAQSLAEFEVERDAIARGLIAPPREVTPVDADAPPPF